jgi:hypothetical protein
MSRPGLLGSPTPDTYPIREIFVGSCASADKQGAKSNTQRAKQTILFLMGWPLSDFFEWERKLSALQSKIASLNSQIPHEPVGLWNEDRSRYPTLFGWEKVKHLAYFTAGHNLSSSNEAIDPFKQFKPFKRFKSSPQI